MNVIRKFHTFWFFHKYRRQINYEVTIKEKDRIGGAYLLLKRYKNRLKAFDQTLSTINATKVDKVEYDKFKLSLEKERAMTLFRDMELLFDSTITDMKREMHNDKTALEGLVRKLLDKQRD